MGGKRSFIRTTRVLLKFFGWVYSWFDYISLFCWVFVGFAIFCELLASKIGLFKGLIFLNGAR